MKTDVDTSVLIVAVGKRSTQRDSQRVSRARDSTEPFCSTLSLIQEFVSRDYLSQKNEELDMVITHEERVQCKFLFCLLHVRRYTYRSATGHLFKNILELTSICTPVQFYSCIIYIHTLKKFFCHFAVDACCFRENHHTVV